MREKARHTPGFFNLMRSRFFAFPVRLMKGSSFAFPEGA
jgi:hypothetical protein